MSAADGPRLPEVQGGRRRPLVAILAVLAAMWRGVALVVGWPVRALDGFIRRANTAPPADTVEDHGALRSNARARRRWWVSQMMGPTVIVGGAVVGIAGTALAGRAYVWAAIIYAGAALLWWVTSLMLAVGQVRAYRVGYITGRSQIMADLMSDARHPALLDFERAEPHPADPLVPLPSPRVVSNANPDR